MIGHAAAHAHHRLCLRLRYEALWGVRADARRLVHDGHDVILVDNSDGEGRLAARLELALGARLQLHMVAANCDVRVHPALVAIDEHNPLPHLLLGSR